ncbi:MAG: hypothetical protein DRH30_08150 [Deltaproteobacteria bacterium]|nr:MAG: hypothetical protein DRH30_08150 [Deltaproteobacteria bacterium]
MSGTWKLQDTKNRFSEVAREWGVMLGEAGSHGEPLPVVDALIGATAVVHDCTVVTRNAKDLKRTGAEVFDPW